MTWGQAFTGGVSSDISSQLTHVTKVVSSGTAFAAIKDDGTVVTWGDGNAGGDSTGKKLTHVTQIANTTYAFAALKNDGTVTTWGNSYYGGDSSKVTLTHVVSIAGSAGAFAALKDDGSVVTWGDNSYGGDSRSVNLTNVKKIVSSGLDFAAYKNDNSVVSWGYYSDRENPPTHLTNVVSLTNASSGFIALKDDGSVVAWGDLYPYGDSTGFDSLSNIVEVFTGEKNIQKGNEAYPPDIFAAVDNNGKLYTWGEFSYGGDVAGLPGLEPQDMIISSTLAK